MPITIKELEALEAGTNAQVAQHGIAFSLTGHFSFDRVNNLRNRPPITFGELASFFDRLVTKHINTLSVLADGDSYNVRCMKTHINIPCVVKKLLLDDGTRQYLHSTVTVMRNPNFVAKDAMELRI